MISPCSFVFVVLVALSILCTHLTVATTTNNDMVIVSESSFSADREKNNVFAVLFYAPWCGFSKKFLPIWDSLPLKNTEEGISFGKVDCVAQQNLYWDYEKMITSFPTIVFFIGGSEGVSMLYEGDRDEISIMAFAEKLSVPAVVTLNPDQEEDKEVVHAVLYEPAAGDGGLDWTTAATMLKRFNAACARVSRVTCYRKTGPGPNEKIQHGIGGYSLQIGVSRRDDMFGDSTYTTPLVATASAEQMVKLLIRHSYGKVVEFSPANEDSIFSHDRPGFETHVVLILSDVASERSQAILKNAHSVADSLHGLCIFLYIDVQNLSKMQTSILTSLKIDASEAPIAAAVKSKDSEMTFYINSDGSLEDYSLMAWASQVLNGKVTPSESKKFDEYGDVVEDEAV